MTDHGTIIVIILAFFLSCCLCCLRKRNQVQPCNIIPSTVDEAV